MPHSTRAFAFLAVVAAASAAACGGDDDSHGGQGGSAGAQAGQGNAAVGGLNAGASGTAGTGARGGTAGTGAQGGTAGGTSGGNGGTPSGGTSGGGAKGGTAGSAGSSGQTSGAAGAGDAGGEAGEAGMNGGGEAGVGGPSGGVGGTIGVGGSSAGVGGSSSAGVGGVIGGGGMAGASSGTGGTAAGGTGGGSCVDISCSGHGACAIASGIPSCQCVAGYAQAPGDATACVDVDECAANHGQCDPLTTCTNLPGSHACGPCPAGYGGTGETSCVPNTCSGAPDVTCACLKVATDGDDVLAAAGLGIPAFANLAPAIEYAATHPNAPRKVCVAEGSACGMQASFPGPSGADLAMRDGVSVYGNYESTGWSRCSDRLTTLAPGSGNGVYFGPTITSMTVLDGFIVARFPAETTAGVTFDGAHGAVVSNVEVGTPAPGATTSYGVDARNGADAALDAISMTPRMNPEAVWSPPNQIGIRAVGSRVVATRSMLRLFASAQLGQAQTATGILLEDAAGSALLDSNVTLLSEVRTTGIHANDVSDLVLDGTTFTFDSTGAGGFPFVETAAELTQAPGASWLRGALSIRGQLGGGVLLKDSPGAHLDVAVNVAPGMDAFTGIEVTGDSAGTVVDGSVGSTTSIVNSGATFSSGMNIHDCAGTAPLVRTEVSVRTRNGGGDAISVSGDCAPTISAAADVSPHDLQAGVSLGQLQTLSAIHCLAPSRCTIDHASASVTGGATPYLSMIDAFGIRCDSSACPTIVDSTASGLSAVGEHRDAHYAGGGVSAPGATLVSRNTISALCSGGNGVGLIAGGRVENNVINGPACGAAFIDGYSRAVGLVGGDVVHSNQIWGGGAHDCWGSCQSVGYNGCFSIGVQGGGRYLNNAISTGGCEVNIAIAVGSLDYAFRASASLLHNAISGVPLVAVPSAFPPFVLPSSSLTTMAEVNALPGASGNFSAGGIDAGTPIEAPLTDKNGVARDESPDVGPYEVVGPPTACRGVYCSNHGVCLLQGAAGACVCDPGYSGADCGTSDPCTVANGGCDPLSTCTLVNGNASCGPCPSGYTGNGASGCVDVDECVADNGGCDPLTTCSNVPGGRTCSPCPDGYVGTGETGCVLGSNCTPNPCEHGAGCIDTGTAYSCRCAIGNAGAACELTPTEVSLGYFHLCTLMSDQTLACWGNSFDGKTSPPSGAFADLAATGFFTCAVDLGGHASCWGSNAPTPPADLFHSIAAPSGGSHVCGIRLDGTVACWGSNFSGQANPPAGTFVKLAANGSTTCGIRSDATLTCWGDTAWGITTPPLGSFKSVSLGGTHACAIALDDSVVCWGGANAYGQATAPSGTFSELAAAGYYTCGIRTNGSITCWGDSNGGQFVPPASGSYHAISAMFFETASPQRRACAIADGGELACWGDALN